VLGRHWRGDVAGQAQYCLLKNSRCWEKSLIKALSPSPNSI
jgi:hypothetical protein